MNDVMILRRGGGARLFAAIGVEYPEGSTCSCTGKNSGRVLTARRSPWIFAVPEKDEWTVKISKTEDGKQVTREQTVEISKERQCVSLVMDYILVLVEDGYAEVEFTAQDASAESLSGVLTVSSLFLLNGYGYYWYKTDMTNISTLYVDGLSYRPTGLERLAQVYVGTQYDAALNTDYLLELGSERAEQSIDVSRLEGEHYVVIAPYRIMVNTDTHEYSYADAQIYSMRLE